MAEEEAKLGAVAGDAAGWSDCERDPVRSWDDWRRCVGRVLVVSMPETLRMIGKRVSLSGGWLAGAGLNRGGVRLRAGA